MSGVSSARFRAISGVVHERPGAPHQNRCPRRKVRVTGVEEICPGHSEGHEHLGPVHFFTAALSPVHDKTAHRQIVSGCQRQSRKLAPESTGWRQITIGYAREVAVVVKQSNLGRAPWFWNSITNATSTPLWTIVTGVHDLSSRWKPVTRTLPLPVRGQLVKVSELNL
jgi:hypothetical protein